MSPPCCFLPAWPPVTSPSPLPPPDGGGGGSTPLVITSTSPAATYCRRPFGLPVYRQHRRRSSVIHRYRHLVQHRDRRGRLRTCRVGFWCTGGNQVAGDRLAASGHQVPGDDLHGAALHQRRRAPSAVHLELHDPTDRSLPARQAAPASSARLALAKDSTGGLHAVYADSVNGDFFYSECASNCALRGSWSAR